MLQFEDKKQKKLKTLFYGLDGTGKSTTAEKYSRKHGLSPVVIDVDRTNYTDLPIVKVDLTNDRTIVQNITSVITDIKKHPDYDTIIIDGVGSLLDLLTPTAIKDQRAYLQRSQNFKKIWRCLMRADLNIIFIGQKDLIITEETESSKLCEKINNMVDFKFKCTYTNGRFVNECTKWRIRKEEPI